MPPEIKSAPVWSRSTIECRYAPGTELVADGAAVALTVYVPPSDRKDVAAAAADDAAGDAAAVTASVAGMSGVVLNFAVSRFCF